jgi:hypothetical protein
MPDSPQRLAQRLQDEGAKVSAFFAALSSDEWKQSVYTEGACWTVRELLAHFVSAEAMLYQLVKNIQHGGAGAPADFDIDAFNQSQVEALSGLSTPALLDHFRAHRSQMVALVHQMNPDDLARQGRHPYLGEAVLEDILKLVYRHHQIHLRDVKRLPGFSTAGGN